MGIIDFSQFNKNENIGQCDNGYSYYSSAMKANKKKWIHYGNKCRTGSIMKCEVNFDCKTVEFYRNNISQGIAYKNIDIDRQYVFAVSIINEEEVQIMDE